MIAPRNEPDKPKRTFTTCKQFVNKRQGCHAQDCGTCANSTDRPIYGDQNKLRQRCQARMCGIKAPPTKKPEWPKNEQPPSGESGRPDNITHRYRATTWPQPPKTPQPQTPHHHRDTGAKKHNNLQNLKIRNNKETDPDKGYSGDTESNNQPEHSNTSPRNKGQKTPY